MAKWDTFEACNFDDAMEQGAERSGTDDTIDGSVNPR